MMKNLFFYLAFLPITACAEPDVDPFTLPPSPDALQGNIQVDPHNPNGGKKFQGVWLVTSDGQKKLLAYNTQSVWAQFDGKSVLVTGADYVPDGQAYSATHYRIDSLKVDAAQDEALYVSVGPKKSLKGTLTLE